VAMHDHVAEMHDHAAQQSSAAEPAHHHDHGGGLEAAADDASSRHCQHCPVNANDGAGVPHDDGHSACAALEEVTNGAVPQAKDTLQTAAPLLSPAAFTLPPPLASPLGAPAPARTRLSASVPLNVRHCVYLI
jgi:hypothetical protein